MNNTKVNKINDGHTKSVQAIPHLLFIYCM